MVYCTVYFCTISMCSSLCTCTWMVWLLRLLFFCPDKFDSHQPFPRKMILCYTTFHHIQKCFHTEILSQVIWLPSEIWKLVKYCCNSMNFSWLTHRIHVWDWYIYLHWSHKHQPSMKVNKPYMDPMTDVFFLIVSLTFCDFLLRTVPEESWSQKWVWRISPMSI